MKKYSLLILIFISYTKPEVQNPSVSLLSYILSPEKNSEKVETYLKTGLNPNFTITEDLIDQTKNKPLQKQLKRYKYWTPLDIATYLGKIHYVKLLLYYDANPKTIVNTCTEPSNPDLKECINCVRAIKLDPVSSKTPCFNQCRCFWDTLSSAVTRSYSSSTTQDSLLDILLNKVDEQNKQLAKFWSLVLYKSENYNRINQNLNQTQK
jgi:hypothetical protein